MTRDEVFNLLDECEAKNHTKMSFNGSMDNAIAIVMSRLKVDEKTALENVALYIDDNFGPGDE